MVKYTTYVYTLPWDWYKNQRRGRVVYIPDHWVHAATDKFCSPPFTPYIEIDTVHVGSA